MVGGLEVAWQGSCYRRLAVIAGYWIGFMLCCRRVFVGLLLAYTLRVYKRRSKGWQASRQANDELDRVLLSRKRTGALTKMHWFRFCCCYGHALVVFESIPQFPSECPLLCVPSESHRPPAPESNNNKQSTKQNEFNREYQTTVSYDIARPLPT